MPQQNHSPSFEIYIEVKFATNTILHTYIQVKACSPILEIFSYKPMGVYTAIYGTHNNTYQTLTPGFTGK